MTDDDANRVLDAMLVRLRDYDRMRDALTAAQEAATRNLERARSAEAERDSCRVAADLDAKEVDAVRDVLRATSSESASDAARRAAMTLFPWPGTEGHPLRKTIDAVATTLKMRPTEAPIDAAIRVMRELDEARVERDKLREERDRIRRVADAAALGVTPLRVCDPLAGAYDTNGDCAVSNPDHAVKLVELRTERDQLRKALDDSRALAERLGEAFDCHPGELPRVGRSLSRAMARIAKCVDKVREDDDEVADAVERLRRERDEYRQAARVEASLGDEARAEAKALREECRAMRAANAKLRARCFELGGADDPVAGVVGLTPREWNEKVKAKLHEIDFDNNEAKAINGDCAIGTPKPGPKLTPLRYRVTGVRLCDGGREDAYSFDGASIDVRYAGAHVTHWELRIGAWSHSANYGPRAVAKDRALTDVNAVLARYGYVLEAWP